MLRRLARVHVPALLKIAAALLLPASISWRRNVGQVPAVICSTKSRATKSVILTHALRAEESRARRRTRAQERGRLIPANADTWRPDDGEELLACAADESDKDDTEQKA